MRRTAARGSAVHVRHLPFLRALLDFEENSPPWVSIAAGLAVLRLVDRHLDAGAGGARLDTWSLTAARQQVGRVDAREPVGVVLDGIVELLTSEPFASGPADGEILAARLFAYGRALELEARYDLAADVYETVVRSVAPPPVTDVAVDAQMRLGYCARMLGRLDMAGTAYSAAGRLALVLGDESRVIRARIANGNLAAARGNLPEAARLLDDAVHAAASPELAGVRAVALHDRAVVAARAGELSRAVGLAHEALNIQTAPLARDRLLTDLATMFLDLGARGPARDALLVLAATAQEQYTRWLAVINLLELAALDGAELVFEQHRRELLAADLPLELAVSFQLTLGEGYRRFGRTRAARRALTCATELAETHGLHQLAFQAAAALAAVERGESLTPLEPAVTPAAVAPAAATVRDLRALAGVG
ncbi:MAG TPA: hypothetical protein VFX39_05730 [Gemmatimonadaceae bacterium]|nr:hypothetical protein [Gemmatimonadaceae bacterium]